ncbi:hypothetical protein [Cellulomonas sp. ATA003]|uniref:hypothetical protein n=1 Tax=Cellulomonas sp. ATA003 TaxID=3073064 RepID=UPI002872B783|nr:hypothetical protein [Cellulomonas sp. ATA003]WNB86454.1 hypothetical protein REH70_04235 [Cellulomonas sp. ATA003]
MSHALPPSADPTISEHYHLTGALPFLNVHVQRDNLLFLDPSAIRNSPAEHAIAAQLQLTSFFDEVSRCARSPHPADRDKGQKLLQQLHEPNETRLGMSANGVAGHGFGDGMGALLWHELRTNPACLHAALRKLEDVPLFIDGVGHDLISDLTTRIVFDVLADFTAQMMITYPSLAVGATTEVSPVWDATTLSWTTRSLHLPFVDGRQLLLVPKGWVYWRLLMDYEAFYNRHSTRTVQDERTTYDRDRNPVKPTKKALNAEFKDLKRLNNQQAVRYIREDVDLVGQYRAEVDAEFEPLDDNQLEERM